MQIYSLVRHGHVLRWTLKTPPRVPKQTLTIPQAVPSAIHPILLAMNTKDTTKATKFRIEDEAGRIWFRMETKMTLTDFNDICQNMKNYRLL